jgi:heterodisulfide reductase subunit C
MDYTPRRLINMARAGFKKEILASQTPWLCASCYSCTVECPQQIKVTDVMYAIKRRALEEGCYPRHMPLAVLAREFFRSVRSHGRVTESFLVLKLFLKTSIARLFGMAGLGIKLMRTGRFNYTPESIKNRRQLGAILDHLENSRGEPPGCAGREPSREGPGTLSGFPANSRGEPPGCAGREPSREGPGTLSGFPAKSAPRKEAVGS